MTRLGECGFLFLLVLLCGCIKQGSVASSHFSLRVPCANLVRPEGNVLVGGRLRGGGVDVDKNEDEARKEKDQALIQQLQNMRGELSSIQERISAIENELEEHQLAVDVLKDYDVSRRCHRAVGGVLMEQTVGTVRPALEGELAMLTKAHQELSTTFKKVEETMLEFQKQNRIRILQNDEVPG